MGNNKNRNRVKGKLAGEPKFVRAFKYFVDNEAVVAKNIAGSDSPDAILDVMQNTYDLELDRNDSEATARLLLNTNEIQNPRNRVDIGDFLDNLYNASRTTQGFDRVIEDVYNSVKLEPITGTHARPVVDIVCTWIITRTFLLDVLDDAKESKPNVDSGINIGYVLSPAQEVRARKLGLEVDNHLFDVDKFYQSECDLAMGWKETHGSYAPAYKIYGMSPREYATWRKNVADLIAELVAENDEVVASENIGNKKSEKKPEKLTLSVVMSDTERIRSRLKRDPKLAKKIIDLVKESEQVKHYIKMAEEEYRKIDTSELEYDLGLIGTTKKLDVKKSISLAMMVAGRTGNNEHDIAMLTIPMFCKDEKFVESCVSVMLADDNIRELKNLVDGDDVFNAPKELTDMVLEWIKNNTVYKAPSEEEMKKMSNDELDEVQWKALAHMHQSVCALFDRLTPVIDEVFS